MHKEKILNFFKSSDKSIQSIIEAGSLFLTKHDIKNAKNEMQWYFQKLYKCNSTVLFSIQNQSIDNKIIDQIIDFLIKRSNCFISLLIFFYLTSHFF